MPTPKSPNATNQRAFPSPPASPSSSPTADQPLTLTHSTSPLHPTQQAPHVYKRRFFGLLELILLNIVVSWSWLTYAPVSTTSAQYFDVSVSAVNWLSTGFLFAFCAATPATIWVLNKKGPKASMVVAAFLILVGNWVRYAGVRGKTHEGYGVVMFGQILIGMGQPFVLITPTRYSDMWFSEKGRVAATAVTSLANPFGGALGQLIDPIWCTEPGDVPSMTLYVALIGTFTTLPAYFIPSRPPSPPTSTSGTSSVTSHRLSWRTLSNLMHNPSFHILAVPFTILASCFNAFSSELNAILYPYNYTEDEAGITGALLILIGLVAGAVASPLLDHYTTPTSPIRLWVIKLLVVMTAITYLAFIWAPQTRTLAAPYAIASIMGAGSFILVPLALDVLVETTWDDAGPEVCSAIVWAGAQIGGALSIIIMDALRASGGPGQGPPNGGGQRGGRTEGTTPPGNMKASLIYIAVLAWLAVPSPFLLGWRGYGVAKRSSTGRDLSGR